ncbi:biotin/lipoyl-containing protein, partial [Achromobacter veterisilvae]|uniref:biotin/lipoyl-containing protein n=1 Tax=Achromobacter veterisilvae TaxID=2069367 RepID=UPI0031342DBE
MSNIVQIKVPDIGDFKEVEVIEVLVAVGDTIKAEQSLITVESDKASMEIPASQGGVVKSINVKVGDKVAEGTVVLEVEAAEAQVSDTQAKTAPQAAGSQVSDTQKNASAAPVSDTPKNAPAPAASTGPIEIQVPDIGDFKEVEVIEIMVNVGDTIKAEQSLITVESDKASMEIPASQGGVVKEVKVKVGDKVAKGSVVVVVEGAAPAAGAAAAPAAKAEAAPAPAART